VAVLQCLNTRDVTILRCAHPVLINIVTEVPWCDLSTAVQDVRRWRAALPAAVGARMTQQCSLDDPALLVGLTSLNVKRCGAITDVAIQRLPSTLRRLVVRQCYKLTAATRFTHLTSLTSLDCSYTPALNAGLEVLPPSVQELYMDGHGERDAALPATNFRHLRALRVLSWATSDACASLPPTVEKLNISDYTFSKEGPTATMKTLSLAHLPRLRVLRADFALITDATVATFPASLEELELFGCPKLTAAVSFAHLRALRTLNLFGTSIDNMSSISFPPSLVKLCGSPYNPQTGASCIIA